MTLRIYVRLWIILAAALAWESYALNYNSFYSLWALLKENLGAFRSLNLSPLPGKTISLWYGWSGLGLMCLTNLYILRKHWAPLRNLGRLPRWLDFHIFCGLLGPTFILFHTNFKIGGLVAISFWSMVISFSSGIVGRYFYIQLLRQKHELEKDALEQETSLARVWPGATAESIRALLGRAAALAGVGHAGTGVGHALALSLTGDFRLAFGVARLHPNLPPEAQRTVKRYARARRRGSFLGQFQSLMGYWHSFHMPFAVFMYLVAAIHVAVALLLGVH